MIDALLIDSAIKFFFVLILVSAAFIITRLDLLTLINSYAVQSVFISIVAFLLYIKEGNMVLLSLAILTLFSKGILIPYVMKRIQKDIKIARDVEFNYLSQAGSIFVSAFIIVLVHIIFSNLLNELKLEPLSLQGAVLGVSLALIGMLIMFSRKKAITKIAGYLTMENGVVLFSLFLTELPFVIEVFIIMDLIMLIALATMLSFGMDATIEEFHAKLNVFKIFDNKENGKNKNVVDKVLTKYTNIVWKNQKKIKKFKINKLKEKLKIDKLGLGKFKK